MKKTIALFILLCVCLALCGIGVHSRIESAKERAHKEEMDIVCTALDNTKHIIDSIKSRHSCRDFDPECQKDFVEWINLHIDDYENAYIRYKDMVGDIPRVSTLPRVSITPIPTNTPIPTSTPTPSPICTLSPIPTCTPIPSPTSTPTPTLIPTPETPEIGVVEIWTDNANAEKYVEAKISVDTYEDISVKIKCRGNSSTWLSKKSYNIKFEDKTDLYELGAGKKWNLLATGYEKTLLRTPIGFWYAKNIGLPYVSNFRIVELWLNDEYRGVYVLIEPVQEGEYRIDLDLNKNDFLIECNTLRTEEGKHYIKTQKGFRFEVNEPEKPDKSDLEFIEDYLNQIETAIMSGDYDTYCNYIDVESFVNYYIFEELTKNVDLGRASTRYFCKDGKLYAGPPWDMDLTMGNVSTSHEEEAYIKYNNKKTSGKSYEGLWANNTNWYKWLCEDEYFMGLVKARWNEMLPITNSLVYDSENGVSVIDRYLSMYQINFENNYKTRSEGGAGWKVNKQTLAIDYDKPASTYVGNVELLEDWLINRIDWLNGEFN